MFHWHDDTFSLDSREELDMIGGEVGDLGGHLLRPGLKAGAWPRDLLQLRPEL
jgi:hypothetical protein